MHLIDFEYITIIYLFYHYFHYFYALTKVHYLEIIICLYFMFSFQGLGCVSLTIQFKKCMHKYEWGDRNGLIFNNGLYFYCIQNDNQFSIICMIHLSIHSHKYFLTAFFHSSRSHGIIKFLVITQGILKPGMVLPILSYLVVTNL